MTSDAHPAAPESGREPQPSGQAETPPQVPLSVLRRQMIEAAAIVAATVVLAVLGTGVFAIAAGVPIRVFFTPAFLASLGWKVPLWALAVVWIAGAVRSGTPQRRAQLATAAAPVAACLAILLEYWPVLSTMGGALIFGVFRWGIDIVWFTVCAGIGSFTAVALTGRLGRVPTWRRMSVLTGPVLTVAGGALILALLVQWLDVYFTLWNTEPVVTEADGWRYVWTAGSAVTLLAAAAVVNAMRGRRSLTVLSGTLLATALLAALLFAVPADRWFPPTPDPAPVNDDYVPCFGEGDPNCVGG
jgi:hypothetical protein